MPAAHHHASASNRARSRALRIARPRGQHARQREFFNLGQAEEAYRGNISSEHELALRLAMPGAWHSCPRWATCTRGTTRYAASRAPTVTRWSRESSSSLAVRQRDSTATRAVEWTRGRSRGEGSTSSSASRAGEFPSSRCIAWCRGPRRRARGRFPGFFDGVCTSAQALQLVHRTWRVRQEGRHS